METASGMESFVKEALKHSNLRDDRLEIKEDKTIEESFRLPRIVVVGCGGAGNNTINRLCNIGIAGADTIAVNTDGVHLSAITAGKKILIGKTLTKGLGAGGFPEVGERAAELSRDEFEEIFEDADLVFITAGMGGGTGTGAAPIIAEAAKSKGAIVVGMVSTPFRVERSRVSTAEDGVEWLRRKADTVIVLDNNKLLDYVPNLPIEQSFGVMDQLIAETIKGLTETITQPSLINLDYADVKTIMNCGGLAVMLVGEMDGQERSEDAIRRVLSHPLLDVDYSGATGCLLHITGGGDLTLRDAEAMAEAITYEIATGANVIWGARIREDFEGKARILAIMTGVHSEQVLGPDVGRNRSKLDAMIGRTGGRGKVPKRDDFIIDRVI
ncbi:MAG: Cell division protein FtsZ 1 [Candidatus Methanolliviera sp. GoM_oil]|nr:MAG: Cell division protein FtsZ 1 [Candidatus Methanolliviera sp. GoM_oil]